VRGSRIKNIVEELGGEKIDIVRWNESSQILIGNALKPAEVTEVALCFELGRATVVVNDDQLSLAIGKRGQNVRLAARLTGWDIDILTPPEFSAGTQRLDQTLKQIEGITQEMVDKIIALGLIDVRDIEEVGTGPLMEELGLDEETAQRVVDRCSQEAKIVAVEQEEKKKADAAAKAAFLAAGLRGIDGQAFGNQPLPVPGVPSTTEAATEAADLLGGGGGAESPAENGDRMPGALEATEGMAPEITTHHESAVLGGGDLSPEEQAIQGVAPEAAAERPAVDEGDDGGRDNADAAALAEEGAARPAGEQ
jgi:N utilization substance protein A